MIKQNISNYKQKEEQKGWRLEKREESKFRVSYCTIAMNEI